VAPPASIRIVGLLIDDDNREKFAQHGLTADQVLQVLDGRYVTPRNRQGRRAPYLLIGQDYGGQCLAVPIEWTDEPGLWRPVTAWRCKPAEYARLAADRRRR
jgi:hypothetical protein